MRGSELRYPTIPVLKYLSTWTEIEYNGVKLYIEDIDYTKRGRLVQAHSVEFTELEKDIWKNEVNEFNLNLTRKQEYKLQKINLRNSPNRKYLIDTITEYAPWFTEEEEDRLEGLLLKVVKPDSIPHPDKTEYRSHLISNHRNEHDRKYFCDVWKLVLSLNITPEEAKAILRKEI